jgi:hypothetical protein
MFHVEQPPERRQLVEGNEQREEKRPASAAPGEAVDFP